MKLNLAKLVLSSETQEKGKVLNLFINKNNGLCVSSQGNCKEDSLASYELICSLQSLIISVEQLQASFLLNPEKYTDELATQPRRLLNTLRYCAYNFRIPT